MWYDFWTNKQVWGRQEITRHVDLSTTPLHVRSGTILPFAPVRQYVDEPTDDPVTLRIYPRQDGEFVLYEDDGVTLDYVAGNATWTRFVCKDSDRKLIIEPHEKSTIKTVEPSRFDVLLVSEGLHKLDRIPGRATSSEILTFRGYLEIQ